MGEHNNPVTARIDFIEGQETIDVYLCEQQEWEESDDSQRDNIILQRLTDTGTLSIRILTDYMQKTGVM